MNAIQSIQTVTGPTLAVALPPAFHGKRVRIVVTPVEEESNDAAEVDYEARRRDAIMEKPPLSEELQKRLAENPDLLRGSVLYYEDPFGPACPPEDWEANS